MQEVSGSIPLSSTKSSKTEYIAYGQKVYHVAQRGLKQSLLQQRPHILPVDTAFHRSGRTALFPHLATLQISAAQTVLQRLEGIQPAGVTAAVGTGADAVAFDLLHAA